MKVRRKSLWRSENVKRRLRMRANQRAAANSFPRLTRLLSRAGFVRAIGRKGKVKGGADYEPESKLPVFLGAENLNPFISNELSGNSNPVYFKQLKGGFRVTVECLEDGERASFTSTRLPWGLSVSPTLAGRKVSAVLRHYSAKQNSTP